MVATKRMSARRLVALLAASGFNEADAMLMFRDARLLSMSEFLDMFQTERERLAYPQTRTAVQDSDDLVGEGATEPTLTPDVAQQIERLLVGEAGLTRLAAARELQRTLAVGAPAAAEELPPFNPKEGFSKWLSQVSRTFTLSQLLHAAASVRNERVHSKPDDWLEKR